METTEDLARRAVACKGWRWLPGMRLRSIRAYLRVVGMNRDGSLRLAWDDPDRPVEGDAYTVEHMGGAMPDLTDPATLGCLLSLVREARKDPNYLPTLLPLVSGARWAVENTSPHTGTWYESEAAALVAALEASP
jgi:hypothetical protein